MPKLYIDGRWGPSDGSATIAVHHAATGEMIGEVAEGTVADVDRAVAAARRAFPPWSAVPRDERLELLARLQKTMSARADELAATIATEVGTPLKISRIVQVGLPNRVLGQITELMAELPLEETVGQSVVVREPIGVVGVITAWNYPLQQVVQKAGAALATGCTVVVKPSEVAPLSALALAEMIDEVGFPPGVFNLVTGFGPVVGEALAAHPGVDMITFTGSTRAGRRVAEVAAATVKRVTLELGGKSANVILDDADLEQAVSAGVQNCFMNSGQTCTAWTRMLVPRSRLPEAEDIARRRAEGYRLGDPLDPATTLGPLATAAQQSRVRTYIERGLAEGARLVTGGTELPDGAGAGNYVAPTIFSDVRPDMAIAREEIFGPVLSILPYDTEDEAIAIANDSIYGLSGAVWSADRSRAERVARRLRTGQVDVNGSFFNPLAPFGGYKQSGLGRELGRYGLEEFLETKSIQLPSASR
jgi:acyl-CoA reductase-like NAD-dependent aldehyde dehydrogenase